MQQSTLTFLFLFQRHNLSFILLPLNCFYKLFKNAFLLTTYNAVIEKAKQKRKKMK